MRGMILTGFPDFRKSSKNLPVRKRICLSKICLCSKKILPRPNRWRWRAVVANPAELGQTRKLGGCAARAFAFDANCARDTIRHRERSSPCWEYTTVAVHCQRDARVRTRTGRKHGRLQGRLRRLVDGHRAGGGLGGGLGGGSASCCSVALRSPSPSPPRQRQLRQRTAADPPPRDRPGAPEPHARVVRVDAAGRPVHAISVRCLVQGG